MHYDPVFYPDYYELYVALGLIAGGLVLMWGLWQIIGFSKDYDRLSKLSLFDLYLELTRYVSAMMTCASRENDAGTQHAARRIWLISMFLLKGKYTSYEKALAQAYFENYLALFRYADRGGDVVAYEKEWHDRWSRKPIASSSTDHPRNPGKEVASNGKSKRRSQKRVYA